MLCLEGELDLKVSFHSRIGQTGIYLKEPDGSKEFLTLCGWVPDFELNLGSGFQLLCWPRIENSLLLTSHLVPLSVCSWVMSSHPSCREDGISNKTYRMHMFFQSQRGRPHIERVHGPWIICTWAPLSSHMVRCALDGAIHACASRSLVCWNFLF